MILRAIELARKAATKPPDVVVERIRQEIRARLDRHRAPRTARTWDGARVARALGDESVAAAWARLAARPPLAAALDANVDFSRLVAPARQAIFAGAERALRREIDLLGTGPLTLRTPIDWHVDPKTGYRWPLGYCKSLRYGDPSVPNDVKLPWETSRLQWLVPAAQAYVLTGDDRYARACRDVLEEWMAGNPYAGSVNWSCTMEVALRIFTWTFFFRACHAAPSWDDDTFRGQLLSSLYLHAEFTERYIERSDVNGNHYTADLAALVHAGLFFGAGDDPSRWLRVGWTGLQREIDIQVYADGVDFEGSIPYHRLVQELFAYPALYRLRCGLDVPESYRRKLILMARFTEAYARDGDAPVFGDADDARTLPFGTQPLADHRYLVGLAGLAWGDTVCLEAFDGPTDELFWLLGPAALSTLPKHRARAPRSAAFAESGMYVLRNERDHIVIDAGRLGLADRGGHGHNDALSFEAQLDGEKLIVDCGAYVYTASYRERNFFRSTEAHNTPRIDGEEINRFVRWDYLWSFHNDARPRVLEWLPGDAEDRVVAAHEGYRRLNGDVHVTRGFRLDHARHELSIEDAFTGGGTHTVEIPFHLAPHVQIVKQDAASVELRSGNRTFVMRVHTPEDWALRIEPARISPSYGVVVPSQKLMWVRSGPLKPFAVTIGP